MARPADVAIALAGELESLEAALIGVAEPGDWLEDPLPLATFMAEHMDLPLWPNQRQDLESFLGSTVEDAKNLFSQSPPTPYNCGVLAYGKGCLGPGERLTDAVSGETRTVAEWASLGRSLMLPSWDGHDVVLMPTSPVYLKGVSRLYRVTLKDGRSFTATAEHRCLSPEGWLPLESFRVGHTRLLTTPLDSNAQTVDWQLDNQASQGGENPCASVDAARDRYTREWLVLPILDSSRVSLFSPSSFRNYACEFCRGDCLASRGSSVGLDAGIAQGFPVGCRPSPHLCDEQLHEALGIGPASAPSPIDALLHNRCCWHGDDCLGVLSPIHSRTCLPSSPHLADTFREVAQEDASLPLREAGACVSSHPNVQTVDAIPLASILAYTTSPFRVRGIQGFAEPFFDRPQSFPHFSEVVDIKALGESSYYDLTVSGTHCYFDAQGICHHNSGKDLIASAMIVWFVHVLFCLRSPKEFLEHQPSEAIDILLASPTLRQTRNITFSKLKKRLKGWGWLQDRLVALGISNPVRYLLRATEAADTIRLPHDINIYNVPLLGANAEGFNTLAFILSEFAGMESDASAETATQVLNTFISSGKTRFNRAWKGFVASFPRSLNDPQEKIIEQHEAGLFPELFVVRRPTWEVHPHRTFEDFKTDFERDPEGSWAKYGARPRAAVEAFFRSPELIVRHASGGDRELMEKFFQGWGSLSLDRLANRMPDPLAQRDGVGDAVLDAFGFPRLHPWVRGKQGIDYYCHIDIGLSRDSSGLAIAHLKETAGGLLPVLDLAFRWKPSHFAKFGDILRHDWLRPGQTYTETVEAAEIDLKTVTDFVIWLHREKGFNLEGATCDGFNSAQLMQTLLQADIPVSLHIVNKADYDEFKSAIYGRSLQYRCDLILHHELVKLEIRAGKVEAPRTRVSKGDKGGKVDSHKDLADAAAAVVARLCRQVAALEDFATLPEPEMEAEDQPATSTPVDVAGDFSEAQQQLMDEFFRS